MSNIALATIATALMTLSMPHPWVHTNNANSVILAQARVHPATGPNCPKLGTIKSPKTSGQSTNINLYNNSKNPASYYWVDTDGYWVKYADLAPGKRLIQPTFVGHVWIVFSKHNWKCAYTVVGANGRNSMLVPSFL